MESKITLREHDRQSREQVRGTTNKPKYVKCKGTKDFSEEITLVRIDSVEGRTKWRHSTPESVPRECRRSHGNTAVGPGCEDARR